MLLPEKFWIQTNFESQKFFVPQTFWFLRNVGSKKVLGQIKYLVLKNFGSRRIFGPQKFQVYENFGSQKFYSLKNQTKFKPIWDCLIFVSLGCMQNFRLLGYVKVGFRVIRWVGGGRGCLHLQNKATAWPNLHVRTCKIQAKLDFKLGPSVAI